MIEARYYAAPFERWVAKLFLFCLPFRMIVQFSGLNSMMHGAATYFDFILNAIGILIYLINHRGRIVIGRSDADARFKYFIRMVVILNISSIIMAGIIQITKGSYAGESAFSGILGMEIYFFQYLLIIAYSKHIFNILTKDEIKRVLGLICAFLLVLGYVQFLILTIGEPFRSVLNAIDIFHILMPESNMWKLSLTGSEGASAGTIFAILVLPFLLSRYLETRSMRFVVLVGLWIPLLVMMNSTSAYLMVIADLIAFIFSYYRANRGHGVLLVFLTFVLFIFGMVMAVGGSSFLRGLFPDDISYLIFDKALDLTNGSTVSRTVPLVTNWEIFLHYPVLGCGNGLQGYFYTTFFPSWAYNVAGSDVMTFYATAQKTIVNGGVFFPGFLSGYGVLGGALLLGLIIKIIKAFSNRQSQNAEFFGNYFLIAALGIIVCGFQSEFAGSYVIWFVISLAFVDFEDLIESGNRL